MTGPQSRLLPCGTRLHLHHGPIDLVIAADGARRLAFEAARARFATVMEELVAELSDLRLPMSAATTPPHGVVARRMHDAVCPFADVFVTRMAAVAGAVADEVLQAMLAAAPLRRAYVNNGGDIALYLAQGQRFALAMADHDGASLGRVTIDGDDAIGGVATSGRHGRSHSLGIADSVTVLAQSAAQADVAATLIANAVDLPGNPAVRRAPASALNEDSDLGDRLVVTGCDPLTKEQRDHALSAGLKRARQFQADGLIQGAALFLQGDAQATPGRQFFLTERIARYA